MEKIKEEITKCHTDKCALCEGIEIGDEKRGEIYLCDKKYYHECPFCKRAMVFQSVKRIGVEGFKIKLATGEYLPQQQFTKHSKRACRKKYPDRAMREAHVEEDDEEKKYLDKIKRVKPSTPLDSLRLINKIDQLEQS